MKKLMMMLVAVLLANGYMVAATSSASERSMSVASSEGGFDYGLATDIGGRDYQQDSGMTGPVTGVYGLFFAVCDGHGDYGDDASELVIASMREWAKVFLDKDCSDVEGAIRQICQDLEDKMGGEEKYQWSGTTLVAFLHYQDKYYFFHIGDSRACFVQTDKGGAVSLTRDHSFSNNGELEAVRSRGGNVKFDGRELRLFVNSKSINMSRALGDWGFKAHGLSAEVEINCYTSSDFTGPHAFVLASDGLWDEFNWLQSAALRSVLGGTTDIAAADIAQSLVVGAKKLGVEDGELVADNITVAVFKP